MEVPAQKHLVEAICKGLEQDDDWDDDDDVFEKAYKEAGLKRYKLYKKLLASKSQKESSMEHITSTSSKDIIKGTPKALAGEADPVVKIQNPEHLELTTLAKTTKSAAAAVSTLSQHFKAIIPSLLTMDSSEGGLL